MPDGKKGKNIAVFDLVSKNDDFFCDEVLFVYYWVDKDCVVAEATEFSWWGN